jgi:histidinol-phosphate aminotransferase
MKELIRKNVLKMDPYLPGKPIKEVERELGIKNIIKIASNENPFGPSDKVINAIKKGLNTLNRYPEGSGFYLKKALARKLRIKPENIILGNGTDEIIELLAKAFLNPEDNIVVSECAFIRYKMAGDLMGCKVIAVPMKNFTHDLMAMKKAINNKTKMVFIANPNNPTGTYVSKKELADFMRGMPAAVLVVFDEAYYEYVMEKDYPQTLNYVKEGKSVIVMRTFSKIYSLAGLRIGFAVTKPEIIEYLELVRPPFNTNSLAQLAAEASLNDTARLNKCRNMVQEEKKILYRNLENMGITYILSAANFVLMKMPINGRDVFKLLLKEGVIVRSMEEYKFPEYIRVTIGTKEENRKFIRALARVLNKENRKCF